MQFKNYETLAFNYRATYLKYFLGDHLNFLKFSFLLSSKIKLGNCFATIIREYITNVYKEAGAVNTACRFKISFALKIFVREKLD